MADIWVELVLIGVGIVANGFFAGSEIAVISARISRLAQMREQRVAGAATAIKLKESPDTFLATIQIAITAVGTLASAVGGATAVEALTPTLGALGLGRWAQPAALASVIVVITYFSLVIGELTPKAIALRNPERIAAAVAPILSTLSRLGSGPVRLLTGSTNAVLVTIGIGRSESSPFVSEEEVRYLVREGTAKGIFEKVEEELVHNVFEFADTTVREIMTPRVNIKGLDVATPPDEVLALAAEIGHTHIPLYDGSPEQTIGIVTLKDLVRTVTRGEPVALSTILRPPLFVPESSRVSALLRNLQRSGQGLAMVVDEHGLIVGLVTVEDVLEEIVGEILEEGETSPTFLTRLPDGSTLVDASAPIDHVERALGITLPDSGDYTTIAGFLLHALNAVPTRGTSVVAAGLRWTVVEMEGPRIRRVRIQSA